MARPKKHKEDTEVVSFRVPKSLKKKVRDMVDNLITNNGDIIIPHHTHTPHAIIREMPMGIGHPVADNAEADEWRLDMKQKIKEVQKEITSPPKFTSQWALKSFIFDKKKELKALQEQFNGK